MVAPTKPSDRSLPLCFKSLLTFEISAITTPWSTHVRHVTIGSVEKDAAWYPVTRRQRQSQLVKIVCWPFWNEQMSEFSRLAFIACARPKNIRAKTPMEKIRQVNDKLFTDWNNFQLRIYLALSLWKINDNGNVDTRVKDTLSVWTTAYIWDLMQTRIENFDHSGKNKWKENFTVAQLMSVKAGFRLNNVRYVVAQLS